MAGKKTRPATASSTDTRNVYKSKRKHSDRNEKSRKFPELELKLSSCSTAILMLKSGEPDVVETVLHHLDKFAGIGSEQIHELYQHKLLDELLQLFKSERVIVKRFSLKLLAQLMAAVEECRKLLSSDDNAMNEFVELYAASSDDVLVEYASVLLHYACDTPKRIDALAKNDEFMMRIFNRLTSHDPDILHNSLRLLNAIMSNAMLIASVLRLNNFPIKNLEFELKNECAEVREAAMEGLQLVTAWPSNPFDKEFQSNRFIETLFGLNFSQPSLMILKNLCSNQNFVLKLMETGHFHKLYVHFMDEASQNREVTLGVLMEFAKIGENRKILHQNGIVNEVLKILKSSGSLEACKAVTVMSESFDCLEEMLAINIYETLLDIAMDEKRDWQNRTMATSAFLNVINRRGLKHLASMNLTEQLTRALCNLSQKSFILNVVIILEKLIMYSEIKQQLQTASMANAIFDSLEFSARSTTLMVRLLNLAASFMDAATFQAAFIDNHATELISDNLQSPSSQLRFALCNFITAAAKHFQLREALMDDGILKLLMDNFECSDGVASILNHDLSIKFAIRGRLEVDDRIENGFYASKTSWIDFMQLRNMMCVNCASPRHVIYTVSFQSDGAERYSWINGTEKRKMLKDESLVQLLRELKSDSAFSELNQLQQAGNLAARVANFLQTSDDCIAHQLDLHLTELKFRFQSSVIPIGSLVYGSSFEAALLFKVLGDQLAIKSALVTDGTGRAWNEIGNGDIVDLALQPGQVYQRNSLEARSYLQRIS